jgi:hypothetical protein
MFIVTFARGTQKQVQNGEDVQIEIYRPDAEGRSVCSQYMEWLHFNPDELQFKDIAEMQLIAPNQLWFLQRYEGGRQEFLQKQQISDQLQLEKMQKDTQELKRQREQEPEQRKQQERLFFQKEDYDVDYCKESGVTKSTSTVILTFYYQKILPDHLRGGVYHYPAHITYDTLYEFASRTERSSLSARSKFHAGLNDFLDHVPDNATIGVAHVTLEFFVSGRPKYDASWEGDYESVQPKYHSVLLVFDVLNKRLEYYDPNGRDAIYGKGYSGQSFYRYLERNSKTIHFRNPKVCSIWGSDVKLQQEIGSCALWTDVMAVCRMSGVDREHLPRDFQEIRAISVAIRKALWDSCKFNLFDREIKYSEHSWRKAVNDCQVPQDQIDHMRGLVEELKNNKPHAIADDIEVCKNIALTHRDDMERPPDCNEVDVDSYHTNRDGSKFKESYLDACETVGILTFKGNPKSFPQPWFKKAKKIVFEPRSLFVNLYTDLGKVIAAMKADPNLQVLLTFGFFDVKDGTFILRAISKLNGRLTVDMLLIVGDPEDDFLEQVALIQTFSAHPIVHLLYNDSQQNWDKKVSAQRQGVNKFAMGKKYAPEDEFDSRLQAFISDEKTKIITSVGELNDVGMIMIRRPLGLL